MNISKDKYIINAFVDKSDAVQHAKAVQLLFYGRPVNGGYVENDYVSAIKKAVRICYSDVKYRGRFKDVYETFVSLFYTYLLNKAESLHNIETTLAGWLFIVARNFANHSRKEIDALLGFSDSVEYDQPIDNLISKENENGDKNCNEVLVDETENGTMWAENLVNAYIDRIPNENYRVAIRAILLEGMPREELAEEFNTTYQAVNLLVSHAMAALTNVALTDIRWRAQKNYQNYIHLIKDENDKLILKNYFEKNIYGPGLAVAVRRLIKIALREMKEIS